MATLQATGSAAAEQRAHLFREMTRHSSDRDDHSSRVSSAGSVHGPTFAYETESQQLPAHEVNFQINTSALRRAFPNFSQSGSSDEESIEIGRGLKRSANVVSADLTEDLSFDLGDGVRYRVTGTPPVKPRHSSNKSNIAAARAQLGKENEDPLARPSRGLQAPRQRAFKDTSAATDLQPTVESDNSLSIHLKRPAELDMAVKNTRFGHARKATNGSRAALSEITNSETVIKQSQPQSQAQQMYDPGSQNVTTGSVNSMTGGTHPSFILPDIPQITELISGVRLDGTPLFSRSAKSRSRFQTPQQHKRVRSHIPLENVPIPTDEKVLYASLKMLQDKVATLEQDKQLTEKKLESYELEVLQLRSELEGYKTTKLRGDGSADTMNDTNAFTWKGEKSRLEQSMNALEGRLDRANQKLATSEFTIKSLTKDRDDAHRQLNVAFLDSEELRQESEAVQAELKTVKAQVAKLAQVHEKKIKQLADDEVALRQKIERREKAINQMSALAKELWVTRNALAASEVGRQTSRMAVETEVARPRSRSQSRKTERPLSSANPEPVRARTLSGAQSSLKSTGTALRHPGTTLAYPEVSDISDAESTTHLQLLGRLENGQDLAKEETFLSFMEGDEVAKLRKILDDDRARLIENGVEIPKTNAGKGALPRKSSLRKKRDPTLSQVLHDLTQEIATINVTDDQAGIAGQREPTVDNLTEIQDRTQQSVASRHSERRNRGVATEVTSAFILPDITLTGEALAGQNGELHKKLTTTVIRPVPVSDRREYAAQDGGEQTIRPARDPGLSLAIVIKGLEAEIAQLKVQLHEHEAIYNQHDPALSKRTRKIVYSRMAKLLASIDLRADQVYALYDVLEGQKAKGQMMKEEEVEVTLREVGIDPASMLQWGKSPISRSAVADKQRRRKSVVLAENGTGKVRGNMDDEEVEENDDDAEPDTAELPWEGIEATETQTLPSLR